MKLDDKGGRKPAFSTLCTLLACILPLTAMFSAPAQAAQDPVMACRQARNDDTIRAYSPSLKEATIAAYAKLFPDAQDKPDDSMLRNEAQYRCMNGKLLVCFIGANLPCDKMNTARKNPGADEFCRQNPDEDSVPAAVTGHDTIYGYRCRHGRAQITETLFKLDKRGFATDLWAVLPAR